MKKQLPGTKFQSQKIKRSITLLVMFFLIIRLSTATNVCVNLSPVLFFSIGDAYTIDMNGDGMDDYIIRKGESGGLASIDIECLHSQSLVSYSVVGNCPYAQALSSGDIIDNNLLWGTGIIKISTMASASICGFSGFFEGQFDKFIGLQLSVGWETYLGWLRVEVGMNGEWMVLYNYGYDVNSITAGFGLVPSPQLELLNFTVGGGKYFCFNATDAITTAGNESSFSVQSWGSATMISGGNIRLLPGTVVHWGGSLSGLITTTSSYCNYYSLTFAPAQTASMEKSAIRPGGQDQYRVYPNPTNGKFRVESVAGDFSAGTLIEVLGCTGELIFTKEISGGTVIDVSLERFGPGMFVVSVVDCRKVWRGKVVLE